MHKRLHSSLAGSRTGHSLTGMLVVRLFFFKSKVNKLNFCVNMHEISPSNLRIKQCANKEKCHIPNATVPGEN